MTGRSNIILIAINIQRDMNSLIASLRQTSKMGIAMRGETFLRKLDARLQVTPFLFGAERTLADIAVFPFVRQFRIADPVWFDAQDWSPLKTWLDVLTSSTLFSSIMEKYPLWKETHKEHVFR